MVRKRFIFLSLLIIFSFTGCNTNSNSKSTDKNSDKSTVSKNKIDKPSENKIDKQSENKTDNFYMTTSIPTISRDEQWKDLKITSIDAILKDDRGWAPMGISNDGKIVISVPPQNSKQQEIGLFNISNKSYELIASLTGQAQPLYSDINSNWVVWSEILDPSWLNWKIHAYNRNTHKDKVIYKNAKDKSGNGYPGPDEIPKLNGDKVLWSATLGENIN